MFKYGKAKLIEGVTRIKDGIVNEFLIEGSDKAVLFDTGLDLHNIKDFVSKLTDKEIIVVNSHFHPDHANGNHHFDEVYIGEADMPTFTTDDVYFKLVDDIVTAILKKYPKSKKLIPWIDKLTPKKALMKFNIPGGRSKLCIAVAPSKKHFLFTSIYWAHQCNKNDDACDIPSSDSKAQFI